jgi:hypothetical protein
MAGLVLWDHQQGFHRASQDMGRTSKRRVASTEASGLHPSRGRANWSELFLPRMLRPLAAFVNAQLSEKSLRKERCVATKETVCGMEEKSPERCRLDRTVIERSEKDGRD